MKKLPVYLLVILYLVSAKNFAQCVCAPSGPNLVGPLVAPQSTFNALPNSFGIINDITISGVVNLVGKKITLAPNAKIIVPNGAKLTIDGCYLHGCGCMWYGIQVQAGGRLTVKNASIIEDAKFAIEDEILQAPVSNISVTQTLFNKNEFAIFLFEGQGTFTGPPTVNATIDNNIFTCRNGINYIALQGNPTFFNNIKNIFKLSYNNNPFTQAVTNSGSRSFAGVAPRLLGIGAPVTITGSVFDYLDYGVLAQNTDINVHGNQFSNMDGNGLSTPNNIYGFLSGKGVGVYAFSRDPVVNVANIKAGGGYGANNFFNLFRGVDILSYLKADIQENSFENKRTDDFSNFNTSGNWLGQHAVQLTVGNNANFLVNLPMPYYTVSRNHMLWFSTAIHIMRFYYNTAGINVSCNQINDGNSFPTANKYLWQGIFMEDVGNGTGSATVNAIQISYNNVCKAIQNCILVSGVQSGLSIMGNGTQKNNFSLQAELTLYSSYTLSSQHPHTMQTVELVALSGRII